MLSDDDTQGEQLRLSLTRADALAAWLLATLVTINTSGAGAALALKAGKGAAIAFASGVFLAVLSGMTSWGEAYNRGSALSAERWAAEFRKTGLLDEKISFPIGPEFTFRWIIVQYLFFAAFILNLLSLVAFVVGCVLAALAI